MNCKVSTLVAAFATLACLNDLRAQNELSPLPAQDALSEPLHEKFTAAAWLAFHAGRYQAAITNAELCIARFGEAADRIEAILKAEDTLLPTGTVSEAEKKQIAKYQILHNVATCFLIKGWAEEKLGHKLEARKAYSKATKYTQARSARPTGELFWSPAAKASERLIE